MIDETTTEQLVEIEQQAESVWVCEGWWRTRRGEVKYIRAGGSLRDTHYSWPWTDGLMCFQDNGFHQASKPCDDDLVEYLGLIKQEPQPQPQAADTPATEYTPPDGWRVLQVGERLQFGDMTVRKDGYCYSTERVGYFVGANQRYIRLIEPQPQPSPQPEQQAATIEELRSEVSYVQRWLGESRQRVTQLEELVGSLRTINDAQEKAVEAAGKENTALRNQLAAVKAELASVAADRQRLRIELDAAQQVPADSPELRQLRADLAEVIQERDTYRHAHELLLNDANATHQRTKVMTIEAIVEWLVPIRTCGSQALATAVVSNLPHIMRSLTGLEDEGIE